MSAEGFPNFGSDGYDRAHFDFEALTAYEKQLEQDVAELRELTGSKPYTPSPKAERVAEAQPARNLKLDSAAKFLASLDELLPVAG